MCDTLYFATRYYVWKYQYFISRNRILTTGGPLHRWVAGEPLCMICGVKGERFWAWRSNHSECANNWARLSKAPYASAAAQPLRTEPTPQPTWAAAQRTKLAAVLSRAS